MKILKSLVKIIDIFRDGIHLKINKKEKAKTVLGGFLTILLALASLTILLILAWDIFQKQKLSVKFENKMIPNRPKMTLDSYIFPVSLIVQDDKNSPFLIPKYFSLEVVSTINVEANGNITSTKELYKYIHCKP